MNQPASADDAWLRADQWQACSARSSMMKPKELAEGDTICLGFDGSRGRARGNADGTALIGCRVKDGYLFEVGVWQAREGEDDWEAPETVIDAAVRDCFKRYRVVGMYCDPSGWQSRIGDWEQTWARRLKVRASNEHPMHWWVNRTGVMVKALAAFAEAVDNGDITHDGSYRLTQHVLNARRNPTPRVGMQIAKSYPDSPNKIDAAVAAVLAWQARLDALSRNLGSGSGTGRVIVLG